MKKQYLLLIIIIFLNLNSFAQKWQWAIKYGADGKDYNYPYHMVLDSAGNAYVFGNYGNGTQIDTMELPWFASHDANSYIAKFTTDGHCAWYRAINSQSNVDRASFLMITNNKLYLWGSVHFDSYYNTVFLDTTVYGGNLNQQWNSNPNWKNNFPWIPGSNYNIISCLDLNGDILQNKFLSFNQLRNVLPITNPSAFYIDNGGNYYIINYLNNFIGQKYVLYVLAPKIIRHDYR